jgi:hypothetical protein
MTRLVLISGALLISMGLTWLFPILFELSQGEVLSKMGRKVVWLSPLLIVAGSLSALWALRRPEAHQMPTPVRLAITGNVLFLSFCALELSDGLVRQDGRVFYWTSVLFFPALFLLIGLALARRWAWWIARFLTTSFALGFIGVAAAIPFGDVRSHGEPVSPWGRVWMIAVTLLFVSAALFVFRVLGAAESRCYFGMQPKPEPDAPPNGGPATSIENSNAHSGPPSVS